ncbi:MAG TPA: cupin domain-containing protein [Hyphomicrobiaceae bacterium]|nr:cupin domain-containing protein [Hyphomicrobiaceae bacterium]
MKNWLVTLAEAKAAPIPEGRRSAELMKRGSMTLRYYAPKGIDPQTPHDQDEIYIVQSGTGFVLSGPTEDKLDRRPFGPGDAIFVPAHHVHRFVEFSSDFAVWVVFWGPVGGEKS